MSKVASSPVIAIVGAGAMLANPGAFIPIALKTISELNPSAAQYVADWVFFTVISLLPLLVAILALIVATRMGRMHAWWCPSMAREACQNRRRRHPRAARGVPPAKRDRGADGLASARAAEPVEPPERAVIHRSELRLALQRAPGQRSPTRPSARSTAPKTRSETAANNR